MHFFRALKIRSTCCRNAYCTDLAAVDGGAFRSDSLSGEDRSEDSSWARDLERNVIHGTSLLV